MEEGMQDKVNKTVVQEQEQQSQEPVVFRQRLEVTFNELNHQQGIDSVLWVLITRQVNAPNGLGIGNQRNYEEYVEHTPYSDVARRIFKRCHN